MAAEIRKQRGIESTLIKGHSGNFIVVLDGQQIFSKKEEGRFPDTQEILDKIPIPS